MLSPGLFQSAFECAHCATVITDAQSPDNPIVYVNPTFTAQTGYALDEVGRPLADRNIFRRGRVRLLKLLERTLQAARDVGQTSSQELETGTFLGQTVSRLD